MLRKMDIRLSHAFDQMIVSKLRTGPTLFTGDKLVLGETWIGSICNIAAEFESLADPDALATIPVLAAICESKSAEVQAMDISDDLKDDILYCISTKRKQLGIDARLRDLNKGRVSSDSADVW